MGNKHSTCDIYNIKIISYIKKCEWAYSNKKKVILNLSYKVDLTMCFVQERKLN